MLQFQTLAYQLVKNHPMSIRPLEEQILSTAPAALLVMPAGALLGALGGWLYGQLCLLAVSNPFRSLSAYVVQAGGILAALLAIPTFLIAFGRLRIESGAAISPAAIAWDAGRALLYTGAAVALGAFLGLVAGPILWAWRRRQTAESPGPGEASEESREAMLHCCQCGVESPIAEHFVAVQRWFQAELFHYCPRCWEKLQLVWQRGQFLRWVAFLGLSAGLSLVFGEDLPLQIGLMLAVATLLTVPRELAQALAACLVGLRVYEVAFGQGRQWWRMTLAGIPLRFKGYPLNCSTTLGLPSKQRARGKLALVYLIALAVDAAFPLLLGAWLWPMDWSGRWGYGHFLVLAGLLRFIGDVGAYGGFLWPVPDSVIDQWHDSFFMQEADEASQAKRYVASVEWCEKGLQEYPTSVGLQTRLASAVLGTENYVRAKQVASATLDHAELPATVRPFLLDVMASANLGIIRRQVMVNAELLTETDRLTREVVRLAPWLESAQIGRGCCLIEQGDLDQGVGLLQAVEPRAGVQYYLALAAAKAGQVDAYRRHLEQAHRLAPDDAEVVMLEKRVAQWLGSSES
jgi:hypothetical protein